MNVDRDEKHPVDITQILPMVEPALTKAIRDDLNQVVNLPNRRYLIGWQQNGNPDLWGRKPEHVDRLTGMPKYPDQEFDYLTEFYCSGDTPEAIQSAAKMISRAIAENELDLAYMMKPQ